MKTNLQNLIFISSSFSVIICIILTKTIKNNVLQLKSQYLIISQSQEMEQEKSVKTLQLTNKIYCKCNSIAHLLCSNQKCTKSAYVCGLIKCQTFAKLHQKCQFIIANNLIKQIQAKRGVLTPKLEEFINRVQKIYQDAIQQLSKDRESFLNWKSNIGLTFSQRQLITYIHEGNSQNIKGTLVSNIKKNIDNMIVQLTKFNLSKLQKFWNKQSVKFDQIRKKLVRQYDCTIKKDFSMTVREWDKEQLHSAVQFQQYTAKMKGFTGYKFAFAENMDFENGTSVSWGLKINQLNSWIAVGIGYKKALAKKDYSWINYTSSGHGGYLISGNSYSWSDSETSQNQKASAFAFSKNDSIYCCYDSSQNWIKFVKNKNQASFKLTVQPWKEENPLAPCVLFYSAQSSVTLIEVDQEIQWSLIK